MMDAAKDGSIPIAKMNVICAGASKLGVKVPDCPDQPKPECKMPAVMKP